MLGSHFISPCAAKLYEVFDSLSAAEKIGCAVWYGILFVKAAVYDTPYENPPTDLSAEGFTLLRRLEEKGAAAAQSEGGVKRYRPCIPREEAAVQETEHLLSRTNSSSQAEATACRMSQRATTCSSLQPIRLRTWSCSGVRVFLRMEMCKNRLKLIFRMFFRILAKQRGFEGIASAKKR